MKKNTGSPTKRKRPGYDVNDWMRDNPGKSLEYLLEHLDEFHDPEHPEDRSLIKRTWTMEEIDDPNVQVFLPGHPEYIEPEPADSTDETETTTENNEPPPKPPAEDPNRLEIQRLWASLKRTPDTPDKPGKVIKTILNLRMILHDHPYWREKIKYNNRKMMTYIYPESPISNDEKKPVAISDVHYTKIKMWVEENFYLAFGTQLVCEIVEEIAQEHSHDPVLDYFESLKWDYKPRIDNWLHDYAGVVMDDYSKSIARCFLISAVARTYDPGCKVDTVLIMSGRQGAKKSSLLCSLAGKEYFSDHIESLQSKDSRMQLQGPLILEMAELDALNKKESEAAKSFIATQVDKFRMPYARNTVDIPRKCVIAGTVNEDEFLRDASGGRRYWPVKIVSADPDGISRVRDQLWAEAVEYYKLGKQWWLDDETEKIAEQHQFEVTQKGDWFDVVAYFCTIPMGHIDVKKNWATTMWEGGNPNRKYITVAEIEQYLGEEAKKMRGRHQNIIRVFQMLKFEKKHRVRVPGFGRPTVYEIPDGFQEQWGDKIQGDIGDDREW